jgi:hypothetical protein
MGFLAQVLTSWLTWSVQGTMDTLGIHSAARYWFRWDFQSCGETSNYSDSSICCIITCLAHSSVGREECLSSWEFVKGCLLHATVWNCWLCSSISCLLSQPVLIWFEVSPPCLVHLLYISYSISWLCWRSVRHFSICLLAWFKYCIFAHICGRHHPHCVRWFGAPLC